MYLLLNSAALGKPQPLISETDDTDEATELTTRGRSIRSGVFHMEF